MMRHLLASCLQQHANVSSTLGKLSTVMCTGVVCRAAPTVVLSVRPAKEGFLNLAGATGLGKHTVRLEDNSTASC